MWFGYDDEGTLRSMELRHLGWKPEVDFNAPSCPSDVSELKTRRAEMYGIKNWIVHECGCPSTASNCLCHNTMMHGFFVENGLLVAKASAVIRMNGVAITPGARVPVGESVTLSVDSDAPNGSKISVVCERPPQQEAVELVVTDGKTPAHLFQNLPIGYCRMGCAGARIKSVSFVGIRAP